MKNKKANKNKKRILYGLIATILVASAGVLFFKRDSVKSVFTKDTPSQSVPIADSSAEPKTNVVDYSPSTPTDNAQINEQKNNADQTPVKQVNASLTATITNTRVVNSLAQASVLVNGTTSGSCLLTLSKLGSSNVQKTVSVIVRNGITTCEDFNIPITSLSGGTWAVKIVLESGQTKSNPAEGTLQVGS